MTSEQKVAANRRNAQSSTGPRTRGGKDTSRLNAVRHGIFAELPLIQGEDLKEFSLLEKSMCAELGPKSPFEEMLVGQIVRDIWRLKRLEQAEQAYLEKVKEAQFTRMVRMMPLEEFELFEQVFPDKLRLRSIILLDTPDLLEAAEDLDGFDFDLDHARSESSPSKELARAAMQKKIDRTRELGPTFLEAIASGENRVPMAEMDRLRRGLMRDIMQKRAALDDLQERRATIGVD